MRKLLIVLLSMVLIVACKRDHLYYATSDRIVVRLNIDWSVSRFSPNGVSVYLFGSDGNRYGDPILSSNINQLTMTLPADRYTIVVHNDSRSEFSNVEFLGSDKLSTFIVRSLEMKHPYYEPTHDEFVAYDPEDIVSATVRNVDVSGDIARYHYDKPELSEYTSSEVIEVDITPVYIVHLAEVQAHILNAHSAVKAPIAMINGLSRGYSFGLECTLEDRVLQEFYIDLNVATAIQDSTAVSAAAATRVDYYEYEDDDIYLDFRTFGLPFDAPDEGVDGDLDDDGALDNLDDMHKVDDNFHDVWIELLFYMADGMLYRVHSDVTLSTWIDDIVIRKKYVVPIEDDLNNYEPYYDEDFEFDAEDEEDLEGGIMDPSVDDWVDVVVPLPI